MGARLSDFFSTGGLAGYSFTRGATDRPSTLLLPMSTVASTFAVPPNGPLAAAIISAISSPAFRKLASSVESLDTAARRVEHSALSSAVAIRAAENFPVFTYFL